MRRPPRALVLVATLSVAAPTLADPPGLWSSFRHDPQRKGSADGRGRARVPWSNPIDT